jgi:hypothetical protein
MQLQGLPHALVEIATLRWLAARTGIAASAARRPSSQISVDGKPAAFT